MAFKQRSLPGCHPSEQIELVKYVLVTLLALNWILMTATLVYGIAIIKNSSVHDQNTSTRQLNRYLIQFVLIYGVLSTIKLLGLYAALFEKTWALIAFKLALITSLVINFTLTLEIPIIILVVIGLQLISALIFVYLQIRRPKLDNYRIQI